VVSTPEKTKVAVSVPLFSVIVFVPEPLHETKDEKHENVPDVRRLTLNRTSPFTIVNGSADAEIGQSTSSSAAQTRDTTGMEPPVTVIRRSPSIIRA
jgi:hypothetical protein